MIETIQANPFESMATVVTVINVWLMYRLAPLRQEVALLGQQVKLHAGQLRNYVPRIEIDARLKAIQNQLDRIEAIVSK